MYNFIYEKNNFIVKVKTFFTLLSVGRVRDNYKKRGKVLNCLKFLHVNEGST